MTPEETKKIAEQIVDALTDVYLERGRFNNERFLEYLERTIFSVVSQTREAAIFSCLKAFREEYQEDYDAMGGYKKILSLLHPEQKESK